MMKAHERKKHSSARAAMSEPLLHIKILIRLYLSAVRCDKTNGDKLFCKTINDLVLVCALGTLPLNTKRTFLCYLISISLSSFS